MFLDYLALFIALVISSVSAYYSISGLTAIFAAAYWPIVIMGSALELGKVVTTMWLRRNWHSTSWMLRSYLTVCILSLMFITSMGIFGFLSRAHLTQASNTEPVVMQLQLLDQQLDQLQLQQQQSQVQLDQLNTSVQQLMNRSQDTVGIERAVRVRRNQTAERNQLLAEQRQLQQQIAELQQQRAPLSAELKTTELEVGPVRYIAALIYGDQTDAGVLEQAVRWVILLLVAVFDPLALALILAVNQKLAAQQSLAQEPDGSKKA